MQYRYEKDGDTKKDREKGEIESKRERDDIVGKTES